MIRVSHVKLPSIHDFGKPREALSEADLADIRTDVENRLAKESLADLSALDENQTYNVLGFQSGGTSGRSSWLVRNEIDVIEPDGQVSQDELTLYAYRLDQAGNQNGQLEQIEIHNGVGLGYKHYLLYCAQQDGISEEQVQKIETHLATDRFVASAPKFLDCEDLSLSSMDDASSGYGRIRQAAENIDNSAETPSAFRQAQWSLFAETANMPGIITSEGQSPCLIQWLVQKVSHMNNGISGFRFTIDRALFQMTRQGRLTAQPVRSTFIDAQDPDAFRLTREQADVLMTPATVQLIALFEKPESQVILRQLYDALPAALENNRSMRKALEPLYKLLCNYWQVKPRFIVEDGEESQTAGMHIPGPSGRRRYLYLYRKPLHEPELGLLATENRHYLLAELVSTMVHEIFHDVQHQLVRGKLSHPAGENWPARIQDYRDGQTGMGFSLSLPALTGHDKYYSHEPNEHDAYYIGNRAAEWVENWAIQESGKGQLAAAG
jgi:hypothetical protein